MYTTATKKTPSLWASTMPSMRKVLQKAVWLNKTQVCRGTPATDLQGGANPVPYLSPLAVHKCGPQQQPSYEGQTQSGRARKSATSATTCTCMCQDKRESIRRPTCTRTPTDQSSQARPRLSALNWLTSPSSPLWGHVVGHQQQINRTGQMCVCIGMDYRKP